MKAIALSVLALGVMMVAVSAEPAKLGKDQLATITAGKISDIKVTQGGNTPSGQAKGVPTVSVNPTGKAPPGQNK